MGLKILGTGSALASNMVNNEQDAGGGAGADRGGDAFR